MSNENFARRRGLHICVITTVHRPDDTRINKEIRSLLKMNYKITYLAPEGDYTAPDGVNYIPLRKNLSRLKRILYSLFGVHKIALAVNADVYHFHDPELIPLAKRLKKRGKKVVYDVHEDYPALMLYKDWLPKIFRKIVARLFDIYERSSQWAYDGVVAVTDAVAERFQEAYTVILPNYPEVDRLISFSRSKSPVIDQESVKFVYFGTINHSERCLGEILQAFRELKRRYGNQVFLTLIGPVFGDVGKKMIKENEDIVEYFPFLPYEKALRLASEHDVGLIISRKYKNSLISSPNKLFEYMALGLGIIASDIPFWHNIIGEEPWALYVDPDDPKDIFEKMAQFVENKHLIKMARLYAPKRVKKYDWSICERKLRGFYESLAES